MELDINCSILCATGYAEESVRQAGNFLRTEGISAVFLGLKSGSVTGATGTVMVPQALLSLFIGDEAESRLPDGLLIAGGAACGQQLLADPRVHRLIQTMHLASRPVGFLYPVSYPLVALLNQQMLPHPFLLQERRASANFLHRFGKQLKQLEAAVRPKL
jgi:hypothetical protein